MSQLRQVAYTDIGPPCKFSRNEPRNYGIQHPSVALELLEIFDDLEALEFNSGADVRAWKPKADYVGGDRWVINVGHNRHRLVVRIFFPAKQMYIRFIGTHAEYDRIPDITTV